MKVKKISIVIPVFNEEGTISRIIKAVKKAKVFGLKKEIIVIDDCSTDKTSTILSKLSKKEIKVLSHSKNQGKGTALRTGLKITTGDIIIIQDADLEYDPADYSRLIEPILKKLDYSDFEINLSKIIIGSDPIGPYLRFGEIEEAVFKIRKMFKKSGLSSKNFFSVLLIYYMCDASSYTRDAGGLPSLDKLFVFDHENKKLEFSEETQIKMNKLVESIFW